MCSIMAIWTEAINLDNLCFCAQSLVGLLRSIYFAQINSTNFRHEAHVPTLQYFKNLMYMHTISPRQWLPLTAISYRPYREVSRMLQCWNWYYQSSIHAYIISCYIMNTTHKTPKYRQHLPCIIVLYPFQK